MENSNVFCDIKKEGYGFELNNPIKIRNFFDASAFLESLFPTKDANEKEIGLSVLKEFACVSNNNVKGFSGPVYEFKAKYNIRPSEYETYTFYFYVYTEKDDKESFRDIKDIEIPKGFKFKTYEKCKMPSFIDGMKTINIPVKVDDLFLESLKLSVQLGKISASKIRKTFAIGYPRAARIIDEMENYHFISCQNESFERDCLISSKELSIILKMNGG